MAYQPPRLWDPHEPYVSRLHDYPRSHSTREHELQRETRKILETMVWLQRRNAEKLIRYVKSYSLSQNSEYQKGKTEYVSDQFQRGSQIWERHL